MCASFERLDLLFMLVFFFILQLECFVFTYRPNKGFCFVKLLAAFHLLLGPAPHCTLHNRIIQTRDGPSGGRQQALGSQGALLGRHGEMIRALVDKKARTSPNYVSDASEHLLAIQQGARSVAEYAVEFLMVEVEAVGNKPPLGVFRQGPK